jgi:hypothetical protein
MISERTKAAPSPQRGARLTQKARRAGWEARMARASLLLRRRSKFGAHCLYTMARLSGVAALNTRASRPKYPFRDGMPSL